MDAKKQGDNVYIVGTTFDDLGASQYFTMRAFSGGKVPKLRDPEGTIEVYRWLHRAINNGLVASCHDLSDGGLGVALAETAFSGDLGMSIDLGKVPRSNVERDDFALFSESPGRFVVTVHAEAADAFEILMGASAAKIGTVTEEEILCVTGLGGEVIFRINTQDLKKAWQKPLRFQEVR